jgi:hypothetical protein
MENSKLLFLKKGDFKSGFFSKKNASEFSFFTDKIVIRPMGLSRLFNSAEIIIFKDDVINIKDGFRIVGYNIILVTHRGEYTLSFLGDKLKVKQILYEYFTS